MGKLDGERLKRLRKMEKHHEVMLWEASAAKDEGAFKAAVSSLDYTRKLIAEAESGGARGTVIKASR